MMPTEKTEVLIVGAGPTGVTLANLLGAQGIQVCLIEKEPSVYPVCRATHMDEETLRNFQMTGLMAQLKPFYTPFGKVDVVDEAHQVLLTEDIVQPHSPHGYSSSCFFDQPGFETVLRQGLLRYPGVKLYSGYEAFDVKQDQDGVTVRARVQLSGQEQGAEQGKEHLFQAQWVVGCDGGRSVVRECAGIEMTALAPRRHWLIVDTLLKDPADAALLPDHFRYILHPRRLTIYAHGFGLNRRWEFQLGHDEAVPADQTLDQWLGEFISPDKLERLRVLKYTHNSLVAERWRQGRVFLAGDAAHMMPPSAGQGLCSGVRDAVNLAWKLARVVQKQAGSHLLDSYQSERLPHVSEILKGTLFISDRLQAETPLAQWWRKTQLSLIGKIPPLQDLLRHLSFRRSPLKNGVLGLRGELRGQHLPQFCSAGPEGVVYSDGRLGSGFVLLAREALSEDLAQACRALGIALPSLVEWPFGWANRVGDVLGKEAWILVRPDRIVFAQGKLSELPAELALLTQMLGEPATELALVH